MRAGKVKKRQTEVTEFKRGQDRRIEAGALRPGSVKLKTELNHLRVSIQSHK